MEPALWQPYVTCGRTKVYSVFSVSPDRFGWNSAENSFVWCRLITTNFVKFDTVKILLYLREWIKFCRYWNLTSFSTSQGHSLLYHPLYFIYHHFINRGTSVRRYAPRTGTLTPIFRSPSGWPIGNLSLDFRREQKFFTLLWLEGPSDPHRLLSDGYWKLFWAKAAGTRR
jgi:hypothetical protein